MTRYPVASKVADSVNPITLNKDKRMNPIVTSGYESRPPTRQETKQIKAICSTPRVTFTRKVANNRGNKRIWLEGKKLLSLALQNGMRFDCDILPEAIVLTFNRDGARKIAGKPERPIIDINTAKLNSVLTLSHYLVTVSDAQTDQQGYRIPQSLRITPVSR